MGIIFYHTNLWFYCTFKCSAHDLQYLIWVLMWIVLIWVFVWLISTDNGCSWNFQNLHIYNKPQLQGFPIDSHIILWVRRMIIFFSLLTICMPTHYSPWEEYVGFKNFPTDWRRWNQSRGTVLPTQLPFIPHLCTKLLWVLNNIHDTMNNFTRL